MILRIDLIGLSNDTNHIHSFLYFIMSESDNGMFNLMF
jgi:hypothetical protein